MSNLHRQGIGSPRGVPTPFLYLNFLLAARSEERIALSEFIVE
jgi:hypothetical protein